MSDRFSQKFVVAPSIEHGQIAARAIDSPRARIITTDARGRGLPPGFYPLPDDVHYAAGWERGPRAARVLAELQRVYAKRLGAVGKRRSVQL